MLADLLGISKQIEIIVIILIGISWLTFDKSLFLLKSNLEEIWATAIEPTGLENFLKILLSGLVLTRAFTVHVFLALYVVILWPAIFEDHPNLLLPWLAVGGVRCVLINVISFLVGTYVCTLQRGLHLVCLDFVLYEVVEYGPSVYAWFAVLSYYRYLVQHEIKEQNAKQEQYFNRRKAKSLSVSYWDQDPDCLLRNIISSDFQVCMKIQSFIEDLRSGSSFEIVPSRSFHSVLEEKENRLSIFDAFDDCTLTPQEKIEKILEITKDDIKNAKRKKDKTRIFLLSVTLDDLKGLDEPHVTKPRVPSVLMLEKVVRKDLTTASSPSLIDETDSNTLKLNKCMGVLRNFVARSSNLAIANESEIASVDLEELNQSHLTEPITNKCNNKFSSQFISKEKSCSANNAKKYANRQENSSTNKKVKKEQSKNVNNDAKNKPPCQALGFRKIVQDVVRSIEMRENKDNNFTGQVSSISKNLLSLPTRDISKKLDIFKSFVPTKQYKH